MKKWIIAQPKVFIYYLVRNNYTKIVALLFNIVCALMLNHYKIILLLTTFLEDLTLTISLIKWYYLLLIVNLIIKPKITFAESSDSS